MMFEYNVRFSAEFTGNDASDLFSFKETLTGQADDNRTNSIEIMLPLKHLGNFWKTLEMPLINCEINLILTWSANCFISSNTTAN